MQSIFSFAKRIKPWGFQGLSLFDVSKFFLEGLLKGAVSTRAAAISYRLIIAIFPVVIVLFSSLPYIPIDNFRDILFTWMSDFFPGNTWQYIEVRISPLFEKGHSNIISIGSVLSVYFASSSVNAIMVGFNGAYHLDNKGNVLIMRLISIALFIVLGLLLIIAIALMIFSGFVFDYLLEHNWIDQRAAFLLSLAQFVLSLSL
ncbi:MAG: YihY/virulence factor BrkB family protein, partial [Flavobacteriales bacterium]|nr:YihY/virulence factor BrkB family protein [Flavobacteriales bacterium]